MAVRAIARRRRNYYTRPRARHKAKTGISLAILAGFAPTAGYAIEGFRRGGEAGITEGIARIVVRLTGYSITESKWHGGELVKGWAPVLMGVLAHKAANKLGVNRYVRKATMGFISI
jgi:hypothetical protein